jgi:hypothetical protein
LSTETAVLLELRAINAKLDRLAARLDAASPAPWPERLNTTQATLYVQQAYHWPSFSPRTLRKWRAEGRLTRFEHPCRWDRAELDRVCSGTLVATETRGRRRGE